MTEIEFSIDQEKKEEVRGLIDEIDAMLEMAADSLKHDRREEVAQHLKNTAQACEQLDEIFMDYEGYNEVKDFWRSGMEAVNEGELDQAVEDIRSFIENFR